MGKRLIVQRRGRGTSTYRANSFRNLGEVKHRYYDEIEKANDIHGKVVDLVHCPGHSAVLAIVRYENGETCAMFASKGLSTKNVVTSGALASVEAGNTLPLKNIPLGTNVYNVESRVGDGGKFVRVAGTSATVVAKTKNKVLVQFPSKKQKSFNENCRATIGIIAGTGKKEKPFVKAGKRFHAMKAKSKLYPKTSGVAMNAVDHPFGCGRGRHIGKPKIPPRHAPPGRNVGSLRARKTGKRK
tara:strand:+ start:5448 stop:6173 length:726 start_codon:yes stop_codon:yes gene_type:complete